MASQVEIFNKALVLLGAKIITDPSESDELSTIYDTCRKELLAEHPWNFALVRAELGQLLSTPEFEFNYQYQLPSDCIRIWKASCPVSNYVQEGDRILTNDSSFSILYISDVTDTAKFSPSFVNCLALKLAKDSGISISDNQSIVDRVERNYTITLARAKTIDAQSDYGFYYTEEGTWYNSRF